MNVKNILYINSNNCNMVVSLGLCQTAVVTHRGFIYIGYRCKNKSKSIRKWDFCSILFYIWMFGLEDEAFWDEKLNEYRGRF